MLPRVIRKPFLLDRKIIALAVFGFVCAFILAGLVNLSIDTQSGVRAYVSSEGAWAKAQKKSLIYLSNYIFTGNEEMYLQFAETSEVLKRGMDARNEMVKDDYNIDIISQNLIVDVNIREDVDDMVGLFRWFRWVPPIENAYQIWLLSDEKTLEFFEFAHQVRESYRIGVVNQELISQWSAQLIEIEADFDRMQAEFSTAMGEMARFVNSVLRWSTITLSFLLFSIGMFLLMRFSKSTHDWAEKIKENEEKFRSMLNISRDVLYKMNLAEEKYEYVSGGLKEMLGYEIPEFLNGGPQWIYSKVHPEDKENMARVMERYKQINNVDFMPIVEFRMLNKKGEYKWVSNSRTLMKDADGNNEAIVGIVRDISDVKEQEKQLRKSLQEKEILLQEIHHRVKNNLSIVISLLELQKDGLDEDIQQMLSDTQSRIKSIANVHEKLYRSATLSEIPMDVYITELAEEIAKAYESSKKKINIEIEAEPYVMELNQAIPCGLVLNELINNSYKHGFKGIAEGIIRIKLKKKEDCMELTVENNGHRLPEDFDITESKSLGMTLIQVLIQRFDGKLTIEKNDWTRFIICFNI